jgi:hypothetical protein
MHKPTPGPYSFAGSEPVVLDGKEVAPGQLFRDNDGSLAIMAPCTGEDAPSERMRIGSVQTTVQMKRGTAWKAALEDDPEQAANARLFREAWALYELAMELADSDTHIFGDLAARAQALINIIDDAQ